MTRYGCLPVLWRGLPVLWRGGARYRYDIGEGRNVKYIGMDGTEVTKVVENSPEEGTFYRINSDKELIVMRDRELTLNPTYWNLLLHTSDTVKAIYGVALDIEYNVYSKGRVKSVMLKDDWEGVGDFIAAKVMQDVGYFEHIAEKTEEAKMRIRSFLEHIQKEELKNLAFDELIERVEMIQSLFFEYDAASVFIWFVAGDQVRSSINSILHLAEEDLNILSLPVEKTFASQMDQKILEVAIDNSADTEWEAEKLEKSFYWILCGYDSLVVCDKKYFTGQIQSRREEMSDTKKKFDEIREIERDIENKKRSIMEREKFTEANARYIDILRQMALWTDERKMLDFQLFYYYNTILSIVGLMYGAPLQQMKYLFVRELKDLRENHAKLLIEADRRMREDFVVMSCGNTIKIVSDEERVTIQGLLERQSRQTEIKGSVASRGLRQIYRATVSVLMSPLECSKVKDGEIIVATMTTPDYVPAMRKALGFITDEGGITCHAAIVARELKKPCIIGTKIATQVLKDGDLVEVDADNGVVRILEQNEDTESSSQMFRNLNPEDFTKTFESEGTKFLFEDLVNTHYMLLAGEGLSILRKTKIVFVNKKSLAEMRAEGENRTTEMTQEKMRFLDALFEEAKSEASVLVNKECLALDEVVRVFRILGAIFAEYFYFDPWYWDGAYELAKSNERMRENITLVQGYKNVARSKFEPVCFGEGNLILILLEKLSVQFDIPVGDLDRYREEEILALFANERVSQEELLARRMLCAFYISPDRKAHLMTGGEVTDVARWFMNEKLDAVTQLKGTPAHSTGAVVTARVYMIRRDYGNKSATEECINRMQQGEVLVSETTDPELIRALKKASAVITDLGGLLSHAAITAREYNLPCIVGVANASKILKDGDLVEVDADNGIIKILKKKL